MSGGIGILAQLENVLENLQDAVKEVEMLRDLETPGSDAWLRLRTIEDRLHGALSHLEI